MKKIYVYFALLASIVVACDKAEENIPQNNQEPDSEVKMIVETISGSYGSTTRATIADADASFAWTAGDNIAVHVSNSTTGKYVFTSDSANGASGADVDNTDASKASFTIVYPEGYSRDAFAVYPSTIVSATAENYGQSGHTLDVTLPSSYTLDQVTGVTSPCPMISANVEHENWTFYQLCSLLRLTVSNIPATAKRLEIDFNGKKVCGDFSIASAVTPDTYVIETSVVTDNSDVITIKKDGTGAALVAETGSLVLNIPLPVGVYSTITVYSYDAISGGNVVSSCNIPFSYTAANTKGIKKTSELTDQSSFTFTFRDADTQTNLGGLRFVRVFSCQDKLYNSTTTFGPYTVSSATDMANPVAANLKFGSNDGDQLAFQVIDANGKVYSGLYNAPTGGFTMGTYNLTVDVKAYTFTVASGKKVYFSPGDLGVDNGTYSFTEPFVTWGWNSTNTGLTKRVWFNFSEIQSGHEIYGVANWRNLNSTTTSTETTKPQEWENIIGRTNMNPGVSAYYRVTVSNHANCLLLPPDETSLTDIGEDLTSGSVTNYAKYLAKGFVLLISTGRATASAQGLKWASATQGWYWALWNNMSRNRTYFNWTDSNTPFVDWAGYQYRMRVRYVHDVE